MEIVAISDEEMDEVSIMKDSPKRVHEQTLDSIRVGVRLVDWSRGYSTRIFRGIVDFARTGHSINLVVEQVSGGEVSELRLGMDWTGDGIIVFRPEAAELAAWRKRGIAVVNLSSEVSPGAQPVPQVTMDNHACGMLAASHLGSLGLRHFAFWHDPHRVYSKERLAGFQAGLSAAGHHPPQVITIPVSTFGGARVAARIHAMATKAMATLQLPCGLFAKDDISAVNAIKVLKRLGLRVPQDVAVLGVADDMVFCHGIWPPLSSIRFPGRKIGHAAAELLLAMIAGEVDPGKALRIQIPPGGVVPRESTGKVELSDPVCTRALGVIHEIAPHRNLTINDVCRLSGASREALRLRFHQTFGRTIKEMIDQTRADAICELLRHTDWTIERISERVGFCSGEDLSRFFKRVKKTSPGRWRQGLE